MLSFGDFKKKKLLLISNKDSLGLNSEVDSYTTIKYDAKSQDLSQEAILPDKGNDKTNMKQDAILHYLKVVNFNNSADTNKNKTKEEENISPTLQVNRIRSLRSVTSGNLARSMSFKSFKNIQQCHKRSHTNSCDSHEGLYNGNPGTSRDPNFTSNSNELIE